MGVYIKSGECLICSEITSFETGSLFLGTHVRASAKCEPGACLTKSNNASQHKLAKGSSIARCPVVRWLLSQRWAAARRNRSAVAQAIRNSIRLCVKSLFQNIDLVTLGGVGAGSPRYAAVPGSYVKARLVCGKQGSYVDSSHPYIRSGGSAAHRARGPGGRRAPSRRHITRRVSKYL